MNDRIGIRITVEIKEKINALALQQSTPQSLKRYTDVAREALEIGLKILEEKATQQQAA